MKFTVLALLGSVAAKHHHHHKKHTSLSMLEGVNVPAPFGHADKSFVPYKAEAAAVVAKQQATEATNTNNIETAFKSDEQKALHDAAVVRVERIHQVNGEVKYTGNWNTNFVQEDSELNNMSESGLVSSLQSTLNQALAAEAKGDGDAAVAKTAAIKNIQKALTARILKRLDDGQPLVEVARKMKAIEGMQP